MIDWSGQNYYMPATGFTTISVIEPPDDETPKRKRGKKVPFGFARALDQKHRGKGRS